MRCLRAFIIAAIAAGFLPAASRGDSPNPPAGGLDSLGDAPLLAELAGRGLDDLLNRAFEVENVPPDSRAAMQSLLALHRLASDSGLSPSQRQQMLESVADNIDRVIGTYNGDVELLLKEGQVVAEQGVDPLTGVLEVWGSSPVARARLRPIAQAAMKIYQRAEQLASARADDLANRITSPDDKLAVQWQRASDVAGAASYQKARMQYAVALSLEPGDGHRSPLIETAAKSFSRWDNADSGIQPEVRLLLAKLQMLRGPGGITAARELLNSLLNSDKSQISPAPSPGLLFRARCSMVIADVMAGDATAARAALDDATADQKANFANDTQQAAALRLLEYRILALAADQAPAGDEKTAANAKAAAALNQLMQDFPGLREVILQQLAVRLPSDSDLTQADPTLLKAVVDQGRQVVIANQPDQVKDKATLQHALDAAREILNRCKAGSLPPPEALEPALLVGVFQEYLGDKVAAVDTLLDYIEQYGSDPAAKADFALERARSLIGELRESSPKDPQVLRVQDRFLPIAINPPFNKREFALQYASDLVSQGKWAEAIKYYHMVPADEDPARVLTARYGEMVAIKNELEDDSNLSDQQRQALVNQIQSMSGAVQALARGLIQSSSPDDEKARARSTLARTQLLAADLIRRQSKDPQRVLSILNGFEDSVQGMPDAKALLSGALFLRVQAYMQLGRNNDATQALVEYLKATGAGEGAQTVRDLLATLSGELDKARADADAAKSSGNIGAQHAAEDQIRQLADNRAMLSGFLVQWAQQSTDPKIHGYTYIYRRFDADTKRQAATLETDPNQRKQELADAMQLYRQLQSPENFTLYQATIDPGSSADRNYPDPLVTLGIGLIAYEQGDCKAVKESLGPLVRDEKLGENNDQVWEATYKLLDCMHTLAKSGDPDTTDAQVQQSLKLLYLIWRDQTGGKKWHNPFESLRQKVMPDWTLPPARQN